MARRPVEMLPEVAYVPNTPYAVVSRDTPDGVVAEITLVASREVVGTTSPCRHHPAAQLQALRMIRDGQVASTEVQP